MRQFWDSVKMNTPPKIRLFSSLLVVWSSFLFLFKQYLLRAFPVSEQETAWIERFLLSHRVRQTVTKEIKKKTISK